MTKLIELHDLPEDVQREILDCAVNVGINIEKIMRWINVGAALNDPDEEEGDFDAQSFLCSLKPYTQDALRGVCEENSIPLEHALSWIRRAVNFYRMEARPS